MKKHNKKLDLNKKTISNLDLIQMNAVAGGSRLTDFCGSPTDFCTLTCKHCYTAEGKTCNRKCQ